MWLIEVYAGLSEAKPSIHITGFATCEVKSYLVYFPKGYVIRGRWITTPLRPDLSLFDTKFPHIAIICIMHCPNLRIQHTGKIQQPSMGWADGNLWGLLRTVAR